VSAAGSLGGGIIAAGEGSRLRAAGYTMPKPLVPVAGAPLIEWTLRNFVAAGISRVVIIVNDDGRACVDWVRSRFPALDTEFIVKTTRSSLESFQEVARRLDGQRAVMSTVDSCCRPEDFVSFVDTALRRPPEASVLAVTPLVEDENPLWVRVACDGRVTGLGGRSGSLVTAGMYVVSERARTAAPPALGRLREFLGWLLAEGEPLYAESIDTVVDVDRATDVALAETLLRTWAQSKTLTGR